MKPLHDFVKVEVTKQEKSLIDVPKDISDSSQEGVVLAIGAEVTTVSPGERVFWIKHGEAGLDIQQGEKHIAFLHEKDLVASNRGGNDEA